MNTISTFDITKEALPDLLLRIAQGKGQIPDLQRSFCWSDELVIGLLASVSLGCPIGAIMLLEQGNAEWRFRLRSVEGVHLKHPVHPTHLILDNQQHATTRYMSLFSDRPVRIKSKRSKKLTDRWHYVDVAKAPNPKLDRAVAIVSLNQNRIKPGFGGCGVLVDCFTPEKEYEFGMFLLSYIFQYTQWRQNYSKYWQYDPTKLDLIDHFEQDVIKRFEPYQVPVIQLRSELPKAAVCRVFEKTNTQGTELNSFELATACFASDDFSLRHDWALKEQRLKQHPLLQSVRETDFLACVTLVKIWGQAPSQYLQILVDQDIARSRLDAILRSHLIEPETLWNDDFEAFVAQRTEALLTLVTQAMGKSPPNARLELDSPSNRESA